MGERERDTVWGRKNVPTGPLAACQPPCNYIKSHL